MFCCTCSFFQVLHATLWTTGTDAQEQGHESWDGTNHCSGDSRNLLSWQAHTEEEVHKHIHLQARRLDAGVAVHPERKLRTPAMNIGSLGRCYMAERTAMSGHQRTQTDNINRHEHKRAHLRGFSSLFLDPQNTTGLSPMSHGDTSAQGMRCERVTVMALKGRHAYFRRHRLGSWSPRRARANLARETSHGSFCCDPLRCS